MKTMNLARNKSIEFILYDLSETIDNILRLAHLENFFNIMDKADLEEHIKTL